MTAQCSALTSALTSKGYNNTTLADKTGLPAGRVDEIVAGKAKPTQAEFNTIAGVLGISGSYDHVLKA